MKSMFIIELSVLTVLILFCIVRTLKSHKDISQPVAYVLASIVVPVMGNIILCASENPSICNAGYVMYLLGTNLVIFSLIDFSLKYCSFPPLRPASWTVIVLAIAADSISIILNDLFRHCYTLKEVTLSSGEIYYVLDSGPGHIIHLCLSAVLIMMVIGDYIWKLYKSPALYRERYFVILLCIMVVVGWEYYNVLMERTIDRSMVGLATGGILVYFFSIEYRPIFVKMALHDLLVTNLSDAVVFFDADGNPLYANKAAASMFGITTDTLLFSAHLLGEKIVGRHFVDDGMIVNNNFRRQVELDTEDGKKYYDVTCQRMEDKKGNYLGAFFGIGDNTQVETERLQKLYRQTHDEMTGMLNREAFIEQVSMRMEVEKDEEFVMILSDILDFKIINDIYGRETADSILIGIAKNIRLMAKGDVIYCRWGGDQFAAFVRQREADPERLDHKMRDFMENRKELKYPVVVHAGYYHVAEKNIPVTTMIDRCVMAISAVRENYHSLVSVYDDKLRQERLWGQRINAELPEALKTHQIFPYLQPQFDSTNTLTGAEVLVRWQHPVEGFLAPYRFIPIFEKNGMIVNVDLHIWEEACKVLASWKGTQNEELHLSVNISPKDFYFIDIYETFTELVKRYDIEPKSLHLEITETVVMNDAAENIRTINRLREYGFIVEMDDFGSGYSSLNLLRDMPVDVLKIDMAFLGKSQHPKKAELILENIIKLARQLSMLSIAEGVEQEEQLKKLQEMGCNAFQGYYFAKPMSLEEFENTNRLRMLYPRDRKGKNKKIGNTA